MLMSASHWIQQRSFACQPKDDVWSLKRSAWICGASLLMVVVHTISKKTDPCICVEYSQLCTLEILILQFRYNTI